MRLEFGGSLSVAASPRRVWERLLDPKFVASCAPGVRDVERIDDAHYRVKTLLGVGSVQLRFAMNLELADLKPPSSARMIVKGTAPGSALHAESIVELSSADGGGTRLDWRVGSDVRGTIASTGARLLKGTARKLTEEFWSTFADRVAKSAK